MTWIAFCSVLLRRILQQVYPLYTRCPVTLNFVLIGLSRFSYLSQFPNKNVWFFFSSYPFFLSVPPPSFSLVPSKDLTTIRRCLYQNLLTCSCRSSGSTANTTFINAISSHRLCVSALWFYLSGEPLSSASRYLNLAFFQVRMCVLIQL
jgi:hypothetical protein